MNTRSKIIVHGDMHIRTKGCNAFSFSDISAALNIKNASIHYYFPSKSELILAIIEKHIHVLEKFILKTENQTPLEKINKLLEVYAKARQGGRISILGALANDFNTFDISVQNALKKLMDQTLIWLNQVLIQGKNEAQFNFKVKSDEMASIIIMQILGAEQLARVTYQKETAKLKDLIVNGLINQS